MMGEDMAGYKIAVVPGDGIGKEIVPQDVRVLDAAAEKFGFDIEYAYFPWGAEFYKETGEFMPENGLEQLRPFDAIFFGAAGFAAESGYHPGSYPADSGSCSSR
jgi:tartrate dehydrogenase/decarboxylase/D-malate dehydrogenase